MIADPNDVAARLDLATTAALAAGRLLERHRGQLRAIAMKGATDLVTEADRAAEDAIVARIAARFPHDRVVAEEGSDRDGAADAGFTWYVDPLDGTTNFVHGLPWFAVSVGVAWRGVPILGVIHAPSLHRTWHAATGLGAWADGRRLEVSEASTLRDGLLATGFPYDRDRTAHALMGAVERALVEARGLRRMGAAALDLAGVADGTFAGYWEPRLKPWDLAAGLKRGAAARSPETWEVDDGVGRLTRCRAQGRSRYDPFRGPKGPPAPKAAGGGETGIVLVREAGGRVTDFEGGDAMLTSGDVIASNGTLHATLARVVHGPAGP